MGGDVLRLNQRHVIDEQAHDAFTLTEVDARVVPDLWQLLGKTENALADLGAECRSLLLAAAFVFLGSFGMTAQLVVPFRLKRICDETVVGVDLHVASAGKLGVIAQPLHMLATCGICLVSARLKFALDFQGDGQRHRRHHLDQHATTAASTILPGTV